MIELLKIDFSCFKRIFTNKMWSDSILTQLFLFLLQIYISSRYRLFVFLIINSRYQYQSGLKSHRSIPGSCWALAKSWCFSHFGVFFLGFVDIEEIEKLWNITWFPLNINCWYKEKFLTLRFCLTFRRFHVTWQTNALLVAFEIISIYPPFFPSCRLPSSLVTLFVSWLHLDLGQNQLSEAFYTRTRGREDEKENNNDKMKQNKFIDRVRKRLNVREAADQISPMCVRQETRERERDR